jgi:hypothetical protein
MTILNTRDFIDSYNALNKAKHPLSHTSSSGYVALATMLEISINWKQGINQIQETLDEKTAQWKNELENLVSGFERLVK